MLTCPISTKTAPSCPDRFAEFLLATLRRRLLAAPAMADGGRLPESPLAAPSRRHPRRCLIRPWPLAGKPPAALSAQPASDLDGFTDFLRHQTLNPLDFSTYVLHILQEFRPFARILSTILST